MPIFDQYDRAVPPDDLSVDHLLKSHPHRVVLAVLVVPGASKTEVVGVHGDALRVRIGAPPEGGRANKDLSNILRVFFGCRVELLSGARARRKRVLLRDVARDDARARIASM